MASTTNYFWEKFLSLNRFNGNITLNPFFSYISCAVLLAAMTTSDSNAQGVWIRKADYPFSLTAVVSFKANNTGYCGGGLDPGTSTTYSNWHSYLYTTDSWLPKSSLSCNNSCSFSFDTCGIAFGGTLGSNPRKYKPSIDTWNALPTAPVSGLEKETNPSWTIGTKGYVVSTTGVLRVFDLSTGLWSTLNSPPSPPVEALGFAYNGFGYVIDFGGGSWPKVVYRYNPSSDSWTTLTPPPISVGRTGITGFIINESIYIGGGYLAGPPYGLDSTFFEYNIPSDTWGLVAPIPSDAGVAKSATFSIHQKGFIVTGNNMLDQLSNRTYMYIPDGIQIDSVVQVGGNCPPFDVKVYFTAVGTFSSSTLIAQLSNTSGSFSTPTAIGTTSYTATGLSTGLMTVTIPSGTAGGTGYRIRLTSSVPSFTSEDNGTDITVYDVPSTSAIIGPTSVTPFAVNSYSVTNHPGSTYNWIITNGNVISGSGTNFVQIQWGSAGTGEIMVIEDNGFCQDTVYLSIMIGTTGMAESMGDFIVLSPNPAHHQVTISGLTGNCTMTLVNTLGQTMLETRTSGSEYILNLSGMPAGVYTLQVANEAGTAYRKLVVE